MLKQKIEVEEAKKRFYNVLKEFHPQKYVKEHPFTSIMTTFGAGMIMGFIFKKDRQ